METEIGGVCSFSSSAEAFGTGVEESDGSETSSTSAFEVLCDEVLLLAFSRSCSCSRGCPSSSACCLRSSVLTDVLEVKLESGSSPSSVSSVSSGSAAGAFRQFAKAFLSSCGAAALFVCVLTPNQLLEECHL